MLIPDHGNSPTKWKDNADGRETRSTGVPLDERNERVPSGGSEFNAKDGAAGALPGDLGLSHSELAERMRLDAARFNGRIAAMEVKSAEVRIILSHVRDELEQLRQVLMELTLSVAAIANLGREGK